MWKWAASKADKSVRNSGHLIMIAMIHESIKILCDNFHVKIYCFSDVLHKCIVKIYKYSNMHIRRYIFATLFASVIKNIQFSSFLCTFCTENVLFQTFNAIHFYYLVKTHVLAWIWHIWLSLFNTWKLILARILY